MNELAWATRWVRVAHGIVHGGIQRLIIAQGGGHHTKLGSLALGSVGRTLLHGKPYQVQRYESRTLLSSSGSSSYDNSLLASFPWWQWDVLQPVNCYLAGCFMDFASSGSTVSYWAPAKRARMRYWQLSRGVTYGGKIDGNLPAILVHNY